jgi:hypothetical protein
MLIVVVPSTAASSFGCAALYVAGEWLVWRGLGRPITTLRAQNSTREAGHHVPSIFP